MPPGATLSPQAYGFQGGTGDSLGPVVNTPKDNTKPYLVVLPFKLYT